MSISRVYKTRITIVQYCKKQLKITKMIDEIIIKTFNINRTNELDNEDNKDDE